MANDSTENFVSNAAAAVFAAALGGAGYYLLQQSMEGTLLAFLCVVAAACAVIFFFLFKYYLAVLGSATKAKGSSAREGYQRLRASLQAGGTPAQLYSERLSRFLDAVDVFFGDRDAPRPTLLSRAFGLRNPAHLWTVPTFDQCLLLALVYPVASIFLVWAVFGHVGPAERAMQLSGDLSTWKRITVVALLGVLAYTFRKMASGRRFRHVLIWGLIGFAIVNVVGYSGWASLATIGPAVASGFIGLMSDGFVILFLGVTVGYAVGRALGFSILVTDGVAIATFGPAAVLALSRRPRVVLLILLEVLGLLGCLGAALFLSGHPSWPAYSPMILFLGFFTLVNAPFDWLSLGLTRGLLRRGIELGRWAPYGLAVLDAFLAAVIVVLLACFMVVGIQAFGLAETLGHGPITLSIGPLLRGLGRNPGAPEFYWIYTLLLSTMIPSLVNLTIGGASLARGLPWIPAHLLRFMPEGRSVPVMHRPWIALLLTWQWFVGAVLALAAQGALIWLVLGRVLPQAGWDLLAIAQWVAALDVPLHIYHIFA